MDNFLIYLVKSALILAIFQSFYTLFLRNESAFVFNRLYILSAVFLSVILPFVSVNYTLNPGVYSAVLKQITVNDTENLVKIPDVNPIGYSPLFLLYFAGVVVALVLFILKIIKLTVYCKKLHVQNTIAANVYIVNEPNVCFTFFKRIYISKTYFTSDSFSDLLAHEKIHAKQLHSADMLFVEIFAAFQWFNPFVFLLKNSLKQTHEYLADSGVIKQGANAGNYSRLLYSVTIGNYFGISHSFTNSLILNRLKMINKKSKSTGWIVKSIFVVPIMLLSLVVFGNLKLTNVDQHLNAIEKNTVYEDTVYNVADKMPEFPGGQEAMMQFMISNVKYPEDAKKQQIMGVVYVSFVVDKSGLVKNVEIAKGAHKLLDDESLRVVKLFPVWTPGEVDGKKVDVKLTIPVKFKLS